MAFVIVGAGAAGIAAAERLRELGKDVVLISRDRRAYSLCALPYVLSGEASEEKIFTHDEKAFRDMGAQPRLGADVKAVEPAKKKVVLGDGEAISYDALLLAPGSIPFVPQIPGAELVHPRTDNVFVFNSLEDTRTLLGAAGRAKSAVVMGAGFSGLECAYALRRRGLDVSVVEMEDRVLPRILDRDMSPPVEDVLEKNGVRTLLRHKVLALQKKDGGVTVRLSGPGKDELEVHSDFVVICIGVRPELSLAKGAGLRTERGIVVGADMRTSDPEIFAAGDAAEFEKHIPAVWLTAVQQGRVAACGMAGVKASFTHLPSVNVATLFGVPVVGIGTPATYLKGTPDVKLEHKGGIWRKRIMLDGKSAGYQSVGEVSRGLVSLLEHELGGLPDEFARAGLHHPVFGCEARLGIKRGPIRASSHTRKPRGGHSS